MTVGNPHKPRLDGIRSLAMLKMEKNFIAHIEKGYPRQPYNAENQPLTFLIGRINDEFKELKISHDNFEALSVMPKEIVVVEDVLRCVNEMREECADISNTTDYVFEKLTAKLVELQKVRENRK